MSAAMKALAIRGVGARTALGLNALQTSMAIRAGLLEPRSCRFVDKRDQPVGMVFARYLPPDVYGVPRWLALAAPAIAEAGVALPPERAASEPALPLLLVLPDEARPDCDASADPTLLAALGRELGVPLADSSRVLRPGAAGLAVALQMASQCLDEGAPAVLLGAIDSHYHPEVAHWLDAACRLHAPGTEDGFVPSEAAAFVLLTRSSDDHDLNGKAQQRALAEWFGGTLPAVLATVDFWAVAEEPGALEPEPAIAALALSDLLEQVLAASSSGLRWLMTNVNGEFHRVTEWGRLEVRFDEALAATQVDRLPELVGDCGAALGLQALVHAASLWSCAAAPAGEAVVLLSSDGADRSALIARAPGLQSGPSPQSSAAADGAAADRSAAGVER